MLSNAQRSNRSSNAYSILDYYNDNPSTRALKHGSDKIDSCSVDLVNRQQTSIHTPLSYVHISCIYAVRQNFMIAIHTNVCALLLHLVSVVVPWNFMVILYVLFELNADVCEQDVLVSVGYYNKFG